MVKNKVLTPVLAGVLGLSIVGSGLGYYFVNKDSNDGKTEGGKAKLTQVADNINNTLGTAEKAIKGELDFAYNATATVSFGEGFTEQAGVSLQPISVTTVTKQKGSNTEADVSLTYGGNNLVSANAIYSRDNKSAYVQIPELSDAYLMVNVDSLKDKAVSFLHRALTLILSLILLRALMLILILTHLKRIWRNTRRLWRTLSLSLLTARKRLVTLTETSTAIQLRNTLSQAMM